MRIKVVPRKFFLDLKGTKDEAEIFRRWNVISICTLEYPPSGLESEDAPFSDQFKSQENVIILSFHDMNHKHDDHVVLFDDGMADQIYDFVKRTCSNGKGYLIHCTAGISRSQAVGLVLNEFLNKFIFNNEEDYLNFENEYSKIRRPNSLVKSILWKRFEDRFDFEKGGIQE